MAVAVTGDARKRRALYGVMLSVFLAAMESTVVATAMPTVVASLGGVHIYSWVFSGFLLTSTVTMPLWGRVSDLFGRRPVYLGGLGIFLLGSALSGASQDMVQLIGFRMLQGLGAGSLMTLGMTMIGELFGLERRARMQGYVSGMWGVAWLLVPCRGAGRRASGSCPSGSSATAWCSPPASMGSSRAWRCSARSRSCRCSCSTSAGCRQRRPASCSCRSCWAGWPCRS